MKIIKKWIFRKLSDHIEFAGMYSGKTNFWIHARLENDQIVLDNPRQVSIPNYAMATVKEMLESE